MQAHTLSVSRKLNSHLLAMQSSLSAKQASLQQQACRMPLHSMHSQRPHPHLSSQPPSVSNKLWPAQYQRCTGLGSSSSSSSSGIRRWLGPQCRPTRPVAASAQPVPGDADNSSSSLPASSSSSSSSSGPQQQQGQGDSAQQVPPTTPQEQPAAAAAAQAPPPAQKQQQQPAQPTPKQQTTPTKPQPAPSSSSKSSSGGAKTTTSSSGKARKQQRQRPFFLFSWLQAAAAAVWHMPTTLTSFLLGGAFALFLLYSWALGSPLKRSHPYRFTMIFNEASKLDAGSPVRMKGVQIGNVASVTLHPSHVEAVAEVADASNIIPQGSRVDINLLGIAADPWIDITPPPNPVVRKDHGPHHPACAAEGLIVCHNGSIRGQLGGSTDFMMKFFLSQHDRTRVKVVDAVYHGKRF